MISTLAKPLSALFLLFAVGTMNPVVAQSATTVQAQPWTAVVNGVAHKQEVLEQGPWNINVLRVEYGHPSIGIEMSPGKGRMYQGETVSDTVKRFRSGQVGAVAAVNGDFWSSNSRMYDPIGLSVSNGMINNFPSSKRSVFALSRTGRPYIGKVSLKVTMSDQMGNVFPITQINSRWADAKDAVLYTGNYQGVVPPTDGKRFAVNLTGRQEFLPNQPAQARLVALEAASTVTLKQGELLLQIKRSAAGRFLLDGNGVVTLAASMPEVGGVVTAVCGGGPAIVRKGKVDVALAAEGISKDFSETRHPRTAVGFDADAKVLWLVTVDGRQRGVSVGMSLEELARYMASIGCKDAMNLDGGGSTSMAIGDRIVNKPSDLKGPRPVTNSIVVVQRPAAAY